MFEPPVFLGLKELFSDFSRENLGLEEPVKVMVPRARAPAVQEQA
jgi:hypothetical protein